MPATVDAERALLARIKASPFMRAVIRYAFLPFMRMAQLCLLLASASLRNRVRGHFPMLWIFAEHDGPRVGSELPPDLTFYELEGSRVVSAGELFGGDYGKLVVLNVDSYT
ncbi:hypothetical protein T492DRAFT_1139597 [Pavlovales sp. CCMP2436]|nr:hypothetical protein T492DRAFT_1139597 [Pavlovales sp. CCMP2436]|mmetsp:Transcript_7288/g.19129  ORF Transcript_7288/g.19129 Transcript_7288/m.19129 type:complete len:111 (-) Transcript_7288:24-356(-)